MTSGVAVSNLRRAPHRATFFVGTLNLLLAMFWWACWLAASRWDFLTLPDPEPYAGHIHSFIMQYQVLPSFFFGFLLTVFPRWIGEPDVAPTAGMPIGIGLFGGQLLTLLGALGWFPGIVLGALLTLGGWLYGLAILGRYAVLDAGRTWHIIGCFLGICFGAVGIALWLGYVLGLGDMLDQYAIRVGTFGLLSMVFFTVAHRMFPFFARSALPGYVDWRPKWVLAVGWFFLILQIFLPLEWVWISALPLFLLTLGLLLRWTPRRRMPPILLVLFIGLVWLPVAFGLFTVQSFVYATEGVYILGRAPAHALFVGFFGSIVIAMVTRVTMGHSGRVITLPAIAGYAFVAIQLVSALRIGAELVDDWLAWQAIAGFGWIVAFLPWVLWAAHVYLVPRVDGKEG